MKKRCASWCGHGCTEQQYQTAVRHGAALAKQLGKKWKSRVWENMGWHFAAVSPCGRLEVHRDGERSFTAYLGEDLPGGRWAEGAMTAAAAVKAVVREAKLEQALVTALVEGL